MYKKGNKILASLIVFIMLLANVSTTAFQLGGVIAADFELNTQNSKTNHANVEFDSYFVEDERTTHEVTKNIGEENKIVAQISVKNAGYLKDAMIEFVDSNFRILNQVTEEKISKIENNIITLNHSKYKAGNFAKNKNGDLIIEFSSEDEKYSKRLFYGMTKDGRYYFMNQTSYTQELNININEIIDMYEYYNFFNIYDSKNLFVTVKNEPNNKNQYLFSINSYYSIVELHNLINNSYYLWNFNDFFNLNETEYFFPYETILFELKESKKDFPYLIVFIPKYQIDEDISDLNFIIKFRFKSFDEDTFEKIGTVDYSYYINRIIINILLMDDDLGILVVISYRESTKFYGSVERRRIVSSENYRIYFNLDFYRNNLQCINSKEMKGLDLVDLFDNDYGGIFFKSIYLKNGYAILIYISYQNLIIDLVKLNYALGGTIMYSKNDINIYMNFLDEFLSDLVKLNEQKVAFVCTKAIIRYNKDRGSYPTNRNLEITGKILYILIIDITSGYWSFSLNQDIKYI